MGRLRYGLIFFCFACLGWSCIKQKRLDNRVSLWRMDRIPYGTRYAYDNLPSVFPEAEIRTSSRFPILYHREGRGDTLRTLIILTPAFFPEPDEMNSLIRFAASGNQVFISSRFFDDTVFSLLHIKPRSYEFRGYGNSPDSIPAKDTIGGNKPGETNPERILKKLQWSACWIRSG